MQTIEQTISDRKIKGNIKIYIWIHLFAYMCMHIQWATKLFGCLGVLDCALNIYFD